MNRGLKRLTTILLLVDEVLSLHRSDLKRLITFSGCSSIDKNRKDDNTIGFNKGLKSFLRNKSFSENASGGSEMIINLMTFYCFAAAGETDDEWLCVEFAY